MLAVVFFFTFCFPTFLSLCSLSTVSNSFYLLLLFSILSYSFQISLKAVLPSHSRSSSPPFSIHFLSFSLPVFHLPFFPHGRPMSTYSSPILPETFPLGKSEKNGGEEAGSWKQWRETTALYMTSAPHNWEVYYWLVFLYPNQVWPHVRE